ncbi:hypothetical protein ACJRO7_000611 [Eucalyptus globulus]|uniref:Protein LURP-one-related 8 n=1 Tax=Eucalyptus globulus TaxID=34317 RepID=A0ABD3LNA4_EUCGL
MTKVHPNAAAAAAAAAQAAAPARGFSLSYGKEEVLTVWKKSLLLNCNGFTVFDCKGNLVFRVDNYLAGNKGEVVLMDAAGKPLLTVRRKRLSLSDNWQVFDGEAAANPRFTARKNANLLNNKGLAQVSNGAAAGGGSGSGSSSPSSAPSSPSSSWSPRSGGRNVAYEIEGSYAQRRCTVYDATRRVVAEIRQKEAVGSDVFRLVVQPGMDTAVAMALVILLDQMFGSSRRFSS